MHKNKAAGENSYISTDIFISSLRHDFDTKVDFLLVSNGIGQTLSHNHTIYIYIS